jgi:aspartate kinase
MNRPLVIKFGGSSVCEPENFITIADIIVKRKELYSQIVVVVSAMGDTTDNLLSLAKKVNPNPPTREQDMLVSVGERISISLLAMALSLKNIKAISFTGSQSGIITCDNHSNAKIIDVKPHRIEEYLAKGYVVIVAGFQGVSKSKEITTLGRGGSDTSAVALAVALGSKKVEFYKDVEGIFDKDPHQHKEAQLFKRLSFEQALDVVGKNSQVLHPRCVQLAMRNNISLQILSFKTQELSKDISTLGTIISSFGVREDKKYFYEQEVI